MKIPDEEPPAENGIQLVSKPGNVTSNNGNGGSLQGKTILLVNTGSYKKRFILQKLKKLGLQLIVVSKEKNWAQPYVDHWIIADNQNHSETLQTIEKFIIDNPQVKINGALTFWEDDVLLTSKIVDKFNFIGIPYNVAKKIRNKYLFRDFCETNKIPAPKYILTKSISDLEFVKQNFKFPVVVKPAYGSSSAFVVRVDQKEDLEEIYQYVRNNISTQIESALADGLDIFVEEYIDGDEVDIDIILQNGKIKFSTISDNFNKNKDIFFVDNGQAIPSNLPVKDQETLMELAEETLEKLGLQNGCIHFEAKSAKNGIFPIEINLRMGGDYVYSYIKDAWHVDLIEYAVKVAIGQYIKTHKPEIPKKYIIGWDLHPDHSGVLVELDIDEKIKQKKYIEDMNIYKEIGDPALVPPEGYEYLGWLTVSGDNFLDARDNLEEALKYIKYKVVKFDQDSSIGKTLRKNRFSSAVLSKNMLMRAAKIANIKKVSRENQRNLHIGILYNVDQSPDDFPKRDLYETAHNIEQTLQERGYRTTLLNCNDIGSMINKIQNSDIGLVLNVAESLYSLNFFKPHIASLLDMLQIPYTGSDLFTMALSLDKIRVKKLLTYHNIPTPKWDYAYSMDDEIDEELQYPLIVKPGNTDNSVGITNESVVANKKELKLQLENIILKMGRPALVEEYIDGDEYGACILGSNEEDLQVLPLSRSIFKDLPEGYQHIYTYEAKWSNNPIYEKIIVQQPVKNISKKLESVITEIALDTYNIMHCNDYGRVEIRVDKNGNPYVLELNPNPSLNVNAGIPSVAKLVGMEYGDLLEEIIAMAIKRYKTKHLEINSLKI